MNAKPTVYNPEQVDEAFARVYLLLIDLAMRDEKLEEPGSVIDPDEQLAPAIPMTPAD